MARRVSAQMNARLTTDNRTHIIDFLCVLSSFFFHFLLLSVLPCWVCPFVQSIGVIVNRAPTALDYQPTLLACCSHQCPTLSYLVLSQVVYKGAISSSYSQIITSLGAEYALTLALFGLIMSL
jgi:hypothetical protein